jgi:uncharacterized protein YbjT (DUF2867 family)
MAESRFLVTGASGYIGGRLLDELVARDRPVRALARDPAKAGIRPDAEVVRGDVSTPEGLDEALDGVDVAYYLIHSMGRGNDADYAARDKRSAINFGDAARRAGTKRVVYLGGLGPTGAEASEHLRSRHEVAELLSERVAGDFVYARAAMVIGAHSASFEMLRALVERLPAMICPRWVDTRSQPIAIGDVVATLADAGEREDAPGEVQLGGADVLTYRDMMQRYAALTGRRRRAIVKVPVLTPRLSSHWVGLVTPVDTGIAKPLVDGLRVETVVEEAPPAGLNDRPVGFEDAVRAALAGA